MGDKSNARMKAKELGLPVLEGILIGGTPDRRQGDKFPYPVLIKPSAGGGGKGMRIVHDRRKPSKQEAREASREADKLFWIG